MKIDTRKSSSRYFRIVAKLLLVALLTLGQVTCCSLPQPGARPGPVYNGSAHWARDIAQPLINGFASDAKLYTVLGALVYSDGRLPANVGTWSFVAWSPSRQEEFQVTVSYDGSTSTGTRAQTSAPSSNGQPIPAGWANSTVIFDATTPSRDPSATVANLAVFNIATQKYPYIWGINFDKGTPSNHYVNWDDTYLGTEERPVETEVCSSTGSAVVLLVDPYLVDGIRLGLDLFESHLCGEGYQIFERLSGFASPPAIRAYLADLRLRTANRLEGAILIGDFPHAYQWVTLTVAGTPQSDEVISFQYYADLDGIFQASPGYTSPGGHPYSYDVHGGKKDWEIWIGVFPLYKGDRTTTIKALNTYFSKNHKYRTGGYSFPHAYMMINEHHTATTMAEHNNMLNDYRSGQYAMTPLSLDPSARFYFDSPPTGLTVGQGYAALSSLGADLIELDAHGSSSSSGSMTINWIESKPVRTTFFCNSACRAGNLDDKHNVLSSLLYSPTSEAILAHGTSHDSGGMGMNTNGFYTHNIATALVAGKNYGQAIIGHVNVPLTPSYAVNQELHYSVQVILGDPTLKLQP